MAPTAAVVVVVVVGLCVVVVRLGMDPEQANNYLVWWASRLHLAPFLLAD